MSAPTDNTKKPDGKAPAVETVAAAGEGGETGELSAEELQKVAGGKPTAVDWIKAPT